MMSLRRLLNDLSGSITLATTYPPDEYPEDLPLTYEKHKADIKQLWEDIRPRLKQDVGKIEVLDRQFDAMFAAFDVGNKKRGREVAWDLWNFPIRDLK